MEGFDSERNNTYSFIHIKITSSPLYPRPAFLYNYFFRPLSLSLSRISPFISPLPLYNQPVYLLSSFFIPPCFPKIFAPCFAPFAPTISQISLPLTNNCTSIYPYSSYHFIHLVQPTSTITASLWSLFHTPSWVILSLYIFLFTTFSSIRSYISFTVSPISYMGTSCSSITSPPQHQPLIFIYWKLRVKGGTPSTILSPSPALRKKNFWSFED